MWSAVAKTVPFENVHPHTVIFKVVSCQMRPNSPPDAAAYSPFRSIYERCWRQGRDSIENKVSLSFVSNNVRFEIMFLFCDMSNI